MASPKVEGALSRFRRGFWNECPRPDSSLSRREIGAMIARRRGRVHKFAATRDAIDAIRLRQVLFLYGR
jgi:hypothetical protein